MRFCIMLLLCILFISCSESYLVKYSIQGTATTANVLYLYNGESVEESVILPWNKEMFIRDGEQIGLYVTNTSTGEIDCRVYFIGRGNWQTYKTEVSETSVIIKGVIHSTL